MTRARARVALRAIGALAFLLLPGSVSAQRGHLLVVTGLGGEPEYQDEFYRWGAAMVDAARDRLGLADSDIVFLAERPERDPKRIRGRSTREQVGKAIAAIAARSGPGDPVLILLIGHGSDTGGEPRLNLPGPDLDAATLASMLGPLRAQRVAVVNTAASSGGFLDALAAPGRVVVTATRNAGERNETLFGGYFVAAFTGDGADTDKDGRVSLLEAFTYATRETRRAYEDQKLLLTEHARLDGDGDAPAPTDTTVADADARVASAFVLASTATASASADGSGAPDPALSADPAKVADPALRALLTKKRELEARIDSLKAEKSKMQATDYQQHLEELLLDLARTDQAIRKAGGQKP